MLKSHQLFSRAALLFVILVGCGVVASFGQVLSQDGAADKLRSVGEEFESARSDKYTGGRILRGTLVAGEPDIEITVDVPAFRLTLWQNGKEIKTYPIGVGRKDYPISIGERRATEVIWNPSWIPPASDWVEGMKTVKAGEVITAGDSRNPLGKLKIPLGYGYLIHQAAKPTDLGNLVSHGCVRVLQADLYDLAEKIVAARSAPITSGQIARAKRGTKSVTAQLDPPLPVFIHYDTVVVEGGVLSIYPDVYERDTNTIENLHAELEENGVDASRLSNATLKAMIARARAEQKFVVSLKSIERGRALTDGRSLPVIGSSAATQRPQKPVAAAASAKPRAVAKR
ncbi:MAG: L,D-transpeptidase family protein [Pyrinomonadaceae bacterium]